MKNHQPIFIGIDGGGTRCRVRICDANQQILGEATAGSANIFQNHQLAWQSINQAMGDARQQAQLSQDELVNAYIVAGLAGAEIKQCATQLMSLAGDYANFTLLSDAQIACLGAHDGEEGAVYIIGTGSIGLAFAHGQWHQCGGWGFPLDDGGSGAWLGQQAIRAAINQHDHQLAPSPLTQAVWQKFIDKDALILWSQQATSGDYGQLAPLVIDAFKQQDAVAQGIVEQQIRIISPQIQTLTRYHPNICLMGGLAPWVSSMLDSKIRNQLTTAKGDALAGALRFAQKRKNT